MVSFIDEHRDAYGVEPICATLPIAPSTYFRHKVLETHPERRSERAKRDEALGPKIEAVWRANRRVYGAEKIWRAGYAPIVWLAARSSG